MNDPLGPRIQRATGIGRVMAGHAARSTASRAVSPLLSEQKKAERRDATILQFADELVSVVGSMKGAALKIGQVIAMFDFGLSSKSTRDEFAQRLAPLFAGVPPADWPVVKRQLTRELGTALNRLDIDPVPVAAASVGQVHRAILDRRHPVAIKVQYPDIDIAVRADLKNLRLLATLGSPTFPGTNLTGIVEEIAREINKELDYVSEAANQRRAAELARDHPYWLIPRIHDSLCTNRVLVADYIDGERFDDMTRADVATRDRAGEAIYRFYSGGVYDLGEFCADPHPGNVLMMDDGRLAFLDFGLYVRMPKTALLRQKEIARAMMEGRYHDAYVATVGIGVESSRDTGEAELVELMRDVAAWFLTEDEVTMTTKFARRSVTSLFAPGASHSDTVRHTTLPSEHIFSRRTDLAVSSLLGQLEATNRWGSIAREWTHDNPPATEMGRTIARWRDR